MVGLLPMFHLRVVFLPIFSLVNMDDCWQLTRDTNGTIHADPQAFPSDIPALADYIHSRKLKFGLYSSIMIRLYF